MLQPSFDSCGNWQWTRNKSLAWRYMLVSAEFFWQRLLCSFIGSSCADGLLPVCYWWYVVSTTMVCILWRHVHDCWHHWHIICSFTSVVVVVAVVVVVVAITVINGCYFCLHSVVVLSTPENFGTCVTSCIFSPLCTLTFFITWIKVYKGSWCFKHLCDNGQFSMHMSIDVEITFLLYL